MSFKEVNSEQRQDWNQTSTGVGHHYRPGYYFPDSEFKTLIHQPLPPGLAKGNEIIKDQAYDTTYGDYYDSKHKGSLYDFPLHKKAPGHWKVNYVKDVAEKLGQGGWRKPLTMGNQKTEHQDQFCARKGLPDKYAFEDIAGPQSFILQDHHKEGPSKYGRGTTQNPKLQGQPFYVKDQALLRNLDPYITTTHKTHRRFKPEELKAHPKKDIATYWECEGYPKAWGHGLKHNPLPKDSVPRERLPMRDTMIFKTATKIPRLPKPMVPVPHSGLKTLHQDSFVRPSDVRMKENYYCAVDTPFTLPKPGSKSIMTAPKMYNTEYQNVGSGKTITV
ncbi:uncharacterized protein LOC121380963 [Gigantopelta aegis]|uniref:uncharacterized protein LOC121380963 n=1 Tax=Gigantopelta aegis TaxID=1735272 RepID=UPI001B88AF02|nr:uncharacterized protein LOC121380963 [Gigantopelta aegis]